MTSDLAPTAAPAAASARGPIPVSFFSIAVGLLALAAAWRVATPLWQLPPEAAQALTWAGIAVWLVLLVLYAAKWLRHPDEARAELGMSGGTVRLSCGIEDTQDLLEDFARAIASVPA